MSIADVEIHGDRAIRRMKNLEESLDQELDNGAEQVTQDAADSAKDALIDQGSVASETGINSLDTHRFGKHHYATVGRKYLLFVESGTDPHRPDIDARLIIWASQEGWDVTELADHIEEEGTKPHPWIDTAFDPIVKTAPKTIMTHLRQRVKF